METPDNRLSTSHSDFSQLETHVQGHVITPDHESYHEARKAWNRTVDQHPAVIVIPKDRAGVMAAVKLARSNGLPIAVQSTGHGIVRPADGCMLVVTSQLQELAVDGESRTAALGAGLKWATVLAEAQKHGLAPLLGSSPGVGVVGYTLGGGMGWLSRKYGLAVDSVISIDAVTADGEPLRASVRENSDIFWAMCGGGGGSFAVVTGIQLRLFPVTTVYAGNLFYSVELAHDVMTRFSEWIKEAPDELTASVVLMNFPPLPHVPEPVRGKSFVIVRGCYCGPQHRGEALLRFWRNWKAPAMDQFGPTPFAQAGSISRDPVDPVPASGTAFWLSDLSDDAIHTVIDYSVPRQGPPPLTLSEVRLAGGAISRVSPQANAFSHRDKTLSLQMTAVTPTPEAQAKVKEHFTNFKREMMPHLTGNVYINFLPGEEGRQRWREGYSLESYSRLKAVKATYDPDDCFSYQFDLTSKTT